MITRYWKTILPVLLLCNLTYSFPCDTYADSLLTEHFDQPYLASDIRDLLDAIEANKCRGATDKLLQFAETNEVYGSLALPTVASLNWERFAKWLHKHYSSLSQSHLIAIARNVRGWERDTAVFQLLIGLSMKHPNTKVRKELMRWLIDYMSLPDVEQYLSTVEKEPNQFSRSRQYVALTRFSSPKTDSVVSRLLSGDLDRFAIGYVTQSGLKRYNRYDFLPELRTLRTRLEAEANPLKVEEAQRTMKILDEVIPYLEQKKAEKAPIGLPLDWGLSEK